jgi:predicted O-methyltransferase YrrM
MNPIELESLKQRLNAPRLDRWFGRVKREFEPLARRFIGQKINYVEIGTWAGAACEWVAQNILATHPESRGFGIDPYPTDRKKYDVTAIKALAAARVSFLGDRWRWIYAPSSVGLLTARQWLHFGSVDLLYIDGAHEASEVVQDFVLAWPLLKPGSVVIFDDFWCPRGSNRSWPNVAEAVQAIHIAWRGLIKPVGHHHRQHAIEVQRMELGPLREREALMRALPEVKL